MQKRKLIILSGPSGVGKTTIEKELFKDKSLKLCFAISATTRQPRNNEQEGVHYYFITNKEFDELIKNNLFLEWNEHFSNKYGTLKSEITRILSLNFSPIIEVEPIGAKNIINKYDEINIITIFIAPPSIKALKNQINSRATETNEQIIERIKRAKKEMEFTNIFQHIIINYNTQKSLSQIKQILKENM